MSTQENSRAPGWVKRFAESRWTEPLLGTLVAALGIATAAGSYYASIYGGNSNENFFVAQSSLTDAGYYYTLADQISAGDVNMITQIDVQLALKAPDEVIEALAANLSEEALASFERSEDLDQEYYDNLYATADQYQKNADEAYAAAKGWDAIGDDYELLVLLMAVGLGFSGWAALLDKESPTRYVFMGLALALVLISFIVGFGLVTRPLPPMIDLLTSGE